jgi:hypothetical protein
MKPRVLSRPGWRAPAAVVLAVLLAACASHPPPPGWQVNAQGAAEHATEAWLTGNTRVEALEWTRMRRELARTGQPALLARAELLRCATRVASLVIEPCTAFDALRTDAPAAERAYADYLAGRLSPRDAALLPSAQQAIARTGDATALAAITDPLARLVAAGVLFQSGRASPQVLQLAVDTASAQGWRRPLLAWLMVQLKRAEQGSDEAEAARLRRRIELVVQKS